DQCVAIDPMPAKAAQIHAQRAPRGLHICSAQSVCQFRMLLENLLFNCQCATANRHHLVQLASQWTAGMNIECIQPCLQFMHGLAVGSKDAVRTVKHDGFAWQNPVPAAVTHACVEYAVEKQGP